MNASIEKFKNNERVQKVRLHFKENRQTYISCGVTAVVAVVGTALALDRNTAVSNRQVQVLAYKSNQTLEVFIEALGDPGNIIQDTTTGSIYASQGQAARELGITPSRISNQLNGRTPHVEGHVFEKLGKAMVAE